MKFEQKRRLLLDGSAYTVGTMCVCLVIAATACSGKKAPTDPTKQPKVDSRIPESKDPTTGPAAPLRDAARSDDDKSPNGSRSEALRKPDSAWWRSEFSPPPNTLELAVANDSVYIEGRVAAGLVCVRSGEACTKEQQMIAKHCADKPFSEICDGGPSMKVGDENRRDGDSNSLIVQPVFTALKDFVTDRLETDKLKGEAQVPYKGATLLVEPWVPYRLILGLIYTCGAVGSKDVGGLVQFQIGILMNQGHIPQTSELADISLPGSEAPGRSGIRQSAAEITVRLERDSITLVVAPHGSAAVTAVSLVGGSNSGTRKDNAQGWGEGELQDMPGLDLELENPKARPMSEGRHLEKGKPEQQANSPSPKREIMTFHRDKEDGCEPGVEERSAQKCQFQDVTALAGLCAQLRKQKQTTIYAELDTVQLEVSGPMPGRTFGYLLYLLAGNLPEHACKSASSLKEVLEKRFLENSLFTSKAEPLFARTVIKWKK